MRDRQGNTIRPSSLHLSSILPSSLHPSSIINPFILSQLRKNGWFKNPLKIKALKTKMFLLKKHQVEPAADTMREWRTQRRWRTSKCTLRESCETSVILMFYVQNKIYLFFYTFLLPGCHDNQTTGTNALLLLFRRAVNRTEACVCGPCTLSRLSLVPSSSGGDSRPPWLNHRPLLLRSISPRPGD